jgi:cytochrome o ubiquinol oxidase subunit II
MKKHRKLLGILLAVLAVIVATGWYLRVHPIPVLQPAGQIGDKERNLIIFCVLISLVIIVPVFIMLGLFAWRYREGNQHARYDPKLGGSSAAEAIWWLIPGAIIVILATVTWHSSYALDPFKHIDTAKKTLTIQVVALDWKWLFIYPNHDVASVNEAAIPANTPVDFEITSDTVMTSFWDPPLGGQMYAMPGMVTHLNLEAAKTGNFQGAAANISGSGFAGMIFTVKSMSQNGFNGWIASAEHSDKTLDRAGYAALTRPSSYVHPGYYKAVEPSLYDTIVLKYMMPNGGGDNVNMGAARTSY